MKTYPDLSGIDNGRSRHCVTEHGWRLVPGIVLVAALLGSMNGYAQSQSDDFTDGNDDGWTRYNPFAAVGANIVQWSFTNGGYRVRTTSPSPNFGALGPGRAGSIRSEVYTTHFYYSIDLVAWNDTLPQACGILARVGTPGLGTTTGYAFTWDRGNPASSTAGDIDISVITAEAPIGINVTGNDRLHVEPGKTYRFVFIGKESNLEGRVYELPDLTTPKAAISGSDLTYLSGTGGLVIYDNSTGGTNVCDVTFDNYFATDIEPPRLMLAEFFGDWEASWPLEASVFKLYRSSLHPGSTWEAVDTNEVVQFDGRNVYFFNNVTTTNQFFRLERR